MAPIPIPAASNVQTLVSRAVRIVPYDFATRVGVTLIVSASFLSLVALVFVFLLVIPYSKHFKSYSRTNVWGYFASLLMANLIQAVGTVLSLRWIIVNEVHSGLICTVQAILKQTGNVATAVWSLFMAIHLFNLLFLRSPCTKLGLIATLIFGWAIVATVVVLGPAIIQDSKRGPYFGISGPWCWITGKYPTQQAALEYVIEFVSAGLSLVIYSAVLLRVRGNIVYNGGKWGVRWIHRSDSWKLSLGRDLLDSIMLRVARHMVWYPVSYTIIIVPVALARLSEIVGKRVPLWALITTDVLFVLNGFINVMLLLATRRIFPDPDEMPAASREKRNTKDVTGVTPYTLTTSEVSSIYSGHSRNGSLRSNVSAPRRALVKTHNTQGSSSRFSISTIGSTRSLLR